MLCAWTLSKFEVLSSVVRRSGHLAAKGQRARIGLKATIDGGVAHAIAQNTETGSKTVLQLKLDQDCRDKQTKNKKIGQLPHEAIVGLAQALALCSRNSKALQFEADELSKKLNERRFPASSEEVQEARRQIMQSLMNDSNMNQGKMMDKETLEGLEDELRKRVRKLLHRTKYNWKPLTFKTREHAAVYVLARLASNFAEVYSVLQEFSRINFTPSSVLDYGSGCGAGFWAAFAHWENKVDSYQLVEPQQEMSQFAMDMLKVEDTERKQTFIHPNISFRRVLAPSFDNCFDLVIVHRVLIELASDQSREELIENLWKRTKKYLVVIEGSTLGGFNAVMAVRDSLLMGGCELHREQTRNVLAEANLLNDESEAILDNQNMSNYIRYMLIKDMMETKTALPTRLEAGHVFAPCPHDQGCPKTADFSSVCKFRSRWNVMRADGRKKPNNINSGSFSYVIMAKDDRPRVVPQSRLLSSIHSDGHVNCEVCTAFDGIQRFTASKRMGSLYKTIKKTSEGKLLPVEISALCSDSQYDLFNDAVESYYSKD